MSQVKALALGGLGSVCCCAPTPTPTPTTTCGTFSGAPCAVPLTLFWTDANGTFTLINSGGGNFWFGCESLTLSGITLTGTTPLCTCTPGDITVLVALTFICNPDDGSFTAQANYASVCCGILDFMGCGCTGASWEYVNYSPANFIASVCPVQEDTCVFSGNPANPNQTQLTFSGPWTTCSPFSWSGTLTGAGTCGASPPGGLSGVTVTS